MVRSGVEVELVLESGIVEVTVVTEGHWESAPWEYLAMGGRGEGLGIGGEVDPAEPSRESDIAEGLGTVSAPLGSDREFPEDGVEGAPFSLREGRVEGAPFLFSEGGVEGASLSLRTALTWFFYTSSCSPRSFAG